MRKSFNLIWMVFGFLLLIVGCNEDKKSTAFDPNQPVKFTEFMPDSGGQQDIKLYNKLIYYIL